MFPINLLRKGNGNFKLIKSLDQVKYTQNILRGKFLYNLGKIKKKYSESFIVINISLLSIPIPYKAKLLK